MIFSSNPFIFVFLPISLVGFYLLASMSRWLAAVWLVGMSLLFYGYWNPHFLLLLVLSIAWNYSMGARIYACDEDNIQAKSLVLCIAIAGNLLVLAYYKYLFPTIGFFTAHHLLPESWESHIVLPLGISFFTFTQIGYLIDSYDGQARERGLLSYCLFVTFFPHLIAGPILHNREMMPQFANKETYRFKVENLAVGMAVFIFGISKKVLLADPFGFIADRGLAHPLDLSFAESWITVLSYSLQLYFDFSGYSDMAIGIARMFGIIFPANFNSPYKALSIIDFWSRWHMTLTRYLTLYLYNPVALWVARARARRGLKNTKKATRNLPAFTSMVVFPTFFTMGLAGIWHGAGLQFVIFGLLHAVYLSINHAWRMFGPEKSGGRLKILFYWMLTYSAVLIAQIFFLSDSASEAIHILAMMSGLGESHTNYAPNARDVFRIIMAFALCLALPNTQQIMSATQPVLESVKAPAFSFFNWKPTNIWGVALGSLFLFALLRMSDVSKFLYFQF